MRIKKTMIFLFIVCCVLFAGCMCKHEWKEATCVEPQTCALCEDIKGEPLGHEWGEATCTRPKICKVCHRSEGEPLAHTWVDATCTVAKYCSACTKTEGAPLGHDVKSWDTDKEATCASEGLQSGECSRCQNTIEKAISKLNHTEGEWVTLKEATFDDKGIKAMNCTVCGETFKREEFELTEDEKKAYFKAECVEYTYNEIARNPSKYYKEKVKFRGEVIQVIEDGDEYALRVNITPKNYYWDDTIYVSYTKRSKSEPRILEDDIVVLYGYFADTVTYKTVLGASVTIPAVYAIYVEIE